ncbi:MAG: RsmD family RNA methyltransferase [Chitinispirillaceae bacterium]|nr:RsmD family RNA methyltransferase [Chitinispirillaceae bacterium]
MKLRVIGGSLKGRVINISSCSVLSVRPTLESVRKSVIDIIAPFLEGAKVADVCAGSGIMGIEMISRGATKAIFVEKDPILCKEIEKNISNLGIQSRCKVIREDVKKYLASFRESFDIIYYDPPYDDDSLKVEISSIINFLSEKGVLLYERRKIKKGEEDNFPQDITPYDIRKYGETEVCFFRLDHPLKL